MFWGFEIILTNIPMRKHIMQDIGEYHMCEISYNGRWVKLKIKLSRNIFIRVIKLTVIFYVSLSLLLSSFDCYYLCESWGTIDELLSNSGGHIAMILSFEYPSVLYVPKLIAMVFPKYIQVVKITPIIPPVSVP